MRKLEQYNWVYFKQKPMLSPVLASTLSVKNRISNGFR